MTPTKITLEKSATHLQLRVAATGAAHGSVVIEGTPISNGGPKEKTLAHLRKSGARYANRFNIPFVDETA